MRSRSVVGGATSAALAPATIALLGHEETLARLVGAAGFVLAALLVPSAEVRGRVDARPAPLASLRTIRLAPLAFVAALMFGVLDNGVLSLISVFAIQNGHSALDASTLAATGLIGALLFQIPAGRLSDRFSPHAILILCSAAALVCIVAIVRAPADRHVVLPLMLVLGGACEGFYTLGLAAMGRTVPRANLAAANACFIGLCGTGEVLGPLVAVSGGSIAGPSGFIGVFALALLLYLGALLLRVGYSRLPNLPLLSNAAGLFASPR
jgi:MFS family permease